MMEFHISRKARERYRFAESLFSYNGNVVFASVAACRAFAHRMNQVREADKYPDRQGAALPVPSGSHSRASTEGQSANRFRAGSREAGAGNCFSVSVARPVSRPVPGSQTRTV